MRILAVIISLVFCLGCNTAKFAGTNSGQLNGNWIPVMLEIDGRQLPPASFEKQRLSISDSNYIFVAESVDKGIVKYNDGKMDIYGKEGVNKGKHFSVIYKLNDKGLTACYNLLGTHYPESFETKGKPMYFMAVFRKE
ncbi:MAG: hypothetical protein WAT19_15935 [Ferruginibacter sp.]